MTYTEPLLLLFLGIASYGLFRLRHQNGLAGRRAAMIGVLGLVLVSWPPIDALVCAAFEWPYARRATPKQNADAIVVLAAAATKPSPDRPYSLPSPDTYERVRQAAWLFKQWHRMPVVVCGGRQLPDLEPMSATMQELLVVEGVPADMIVTESDSRSTHENAVYGARVLRSIGARRIALVAQAVDMPRAEKCFRKEGFSVVPAPFAFRDFKWQEELLPSWNAIKQNERSLHEAGGLVWYWLHGWI